ncbi:MAG: hypothetical protein HW378_3965 [Anaerolineales bacterium]|nr:hypothetical protein [Anaerolineales bacterium]
MERPDLSQTEPAVRAYIEALEVEIDHLRAEATSATDEPARDAEPPLEPSEPPTTFNLITLSASISKRRRPIRLPRCGLRTKPKAWSSSRIRRGRSDCQ